MTVPGLQRTIPLRSMLRRARETRRVVMAGLFHLVMAGLVPAISIHWHGLAALIGMPATSPGMTAEISSPLY